MISVVFVCGCAQPTVGDDTATPPLPVGRVVWERHYPIPDMWDDPAEWVDVVKRHNRVCPAVTHVGVLFLAWDNVLRALDPADGRVLWELGPFDVPLNGPYVVRGDVAYIASDGGEVGEGGEVFALDIAQGAVLWRERVTDDQLGCGLADAQDSLAVLVEDVGVAFVRRDDGAVVGEVRIDEVECPFAVDAERVYSNFGVRQFGAHALADGRLAWGTDGYMMPSIGALVWDDGALFGPWQPNTSEPTSIMSWRPVTGSVEQFVESSRTPLVLPEAVCGYVRNVREPADWSWSVQCAERGSGQVQWEVRWDRLAPLREPPGHIDYGPAANAEAVFGVSEHGVFALHRASGDPLWIWQGREEPWWCPPLVVGEQVVISDGEDSLVAVGGPAED